MSQTFVLLLMIDAGFVAYNLAKQRNMWWFIVLYWVLLTAKNAVDFMGW